MILAMNDAQAMRHAGRELLAQALQDARARGLRVMGAYGRALAAGGWQVRYLEELNPPLWELGHVAWFEEFWIARNPQRLLGCAADPDAGRAASVLASADGLYNSSQVAHTRRWHLDLPSLSATLRYAASTRERTLRLLASSAGHDASLYFFRLVQHHEDMHGEAWVHMAQSLGLALDDALDADEPAPNTLGGERQVAAQRLNLGSDAAGFAFDNELCAHDVDVAAFAIDRAPVSWARYLPFIEAGGYDDPQWWTSQGWAWRQAQGLRRPRHLAVDEGGGWKLAVFGQWRALRPQAPAMHISAHEALAWCRWAGRRLPTEAEWELAATTAAHSGNHSVIHTTTHTTTHTTHTTRTAAEETAAAGFEWGQVWEWTASEFAPYAGFAPHPYRDYSAPWFDGRPVLRGASFATATRLKHPRYRNYYTAERNDVFAGFRSCPPP